MTKQIKPQALAILNRHIGSVVAVIMMVNKNLVLKEGKLLNVSDISINVFSKITDEGKLNIPFFDNNSQKILHVYNKLNIDLLTGKECTALSNKLNTGDFKVIIDSLKPFINKDIHLVFQQENGIGCANGQFADMGIKELIVKPAPFYNTDLRLAYKNIYHIYGNNDDDLIG